MAAGGFAGIASRGWQLGLQEAQPPHPWQTFVPT
jgi:hypothetical protein